MRRALGQRRARRSLGFTVLELLIALAIVGILAAIAVPTYHGYQERQTRAAAIAGIREIEMRVDQYIIEYGDPPEELIHATGEPVVDPWGNPYEYLNLDGAAPGQVRKDKNLVPINTDYDLYSKGPDGDSQAPLTAAASRDDIVRANDGAFVGLATEY